MKIMMRNGRERTVVVLIKKNKNLNDDVRTFHIYEMSK